MSRIAPAGSNFLDNQTSSCMTETLLSLWIWLRERVDSDLRNTTMAMVSENNLTCCSDTIMKNKEKIMVEHDNLFAELRSKARLCRVGSKELRVAKLKKLLPLMTKFKRCRQQIGLADQHIRVLRVQINAFETGRFHKEMTDTLRASMVAMKKVGITDESDVDNLIGDMEQRMHDQQEVSDSMDLVNSMDDVKMSDESLMQELMAFMGEDDETAAVTDTTDNTTEPPVPEACVPVRTTIPLTVSQQQSRQHVSQPTTKRTKSDRHNKPSLDALPEEETFQIEKHRLLEREIA
jgi:hypothetical protein